MTTRPQPNLASFTFASKEDSDRLASSEFAAAGNVTFSEKRRNPSTSRSELLPPLSEPQPVHVHQSQLLPPVAVGAPMRARVVANVKHATALLVVANSTDVGAATW